MTSPFMIKIISVLILITAILQSCKEDNISAGAKGMIEKGEGSCAPPIDFSSRYYSSYTGVAYFVETVYLDSLNTTSLEVLKHSSDSVEIKNGQYTLALEPGTYSVFLKEPEYSAVYNNKITVYYEKVTEQDFKFWHCTGY